jgi:hypothetical protein
VRSRVNFDSDNSGTGILDDIIPNSNDFFYPYICTGTGILLAVAKMCVINSYIKKLGLILQRLINGIFSSV